jgi:co-chaperonin GroES (HSP10)
MKITGNLIPLRDNVFVSDMNFDTEITSGGIILQSSDGKSEGIHPRWGRVWAVGPKQTDVRVGEWIMIEHGRWTRGFEYENADGTITTLRMVEKKSIMMSADEKPSDSQRKNSVGAGSNVNFNIPGL